MFTTRSISTKASRFLTTNLATLRVHGPDGKGIVAACSNLLDRRGYGIVGTEHWTDRTDGRLFLRIVFDKETTPGTSPESAAEAEMELNLFCGQRRLQYDLNWRNTKKKIAIMVSKYDHCLWELLLRSNAGELDCNIAVIISNHPDLKSVADTFSIPFEVFPITPQNKTSQEIKEIDLLRDTYEVDVVVLARYMQVLTEKFLDAFPCGIINIHHSFLPAFTGGKPHHSAHRRGVKLIGATAHYVTAVLDEGPIIGQDVIQVSHRDGVEGLIGKGRILERNVLLDALEAHLDDRVIVYKNRCIVFSE